MTPFERAAVAAVKPAERVETARRMARALAYLMRVAGAAGLPRVTAKLAAAQAEALVASGQALIDVAAVKARHEGIQYEPQHDDLPRRH